MFYNRSLLGLERLAYDLPSCGDAEVLPLYEEEHAKGLGPAELLRRAAQELRHRGPDSGLEATGEDPV